FANLTEAARTVSDIIASRIIPATLEFMDQGTLRVVEDFKRIGLPTDAAAMLLIGQDGDPETVDRDVEQIAAICRQNRAVQVKVATNAEEADEVMTA
ncbi:glycolate oxidase subunit GlcD, partial [Anoxybacillus sp. LAT_38]|nr:glycolate oxidase subunit GlcD [Anoxybacillus sp. LAT_38]